MRRLLSLIGLAMVLGSPQAIAGTPPIVMEAKGSPSRVVFVLHEGAWVQVRTLPFPDGATPAPFPDPTPGPTPDPDPPVPPAPVVVVTDPLKLIFVADASASVENLAEQGDWKRNIVIDAAMGPLDATWHWYPSNDPGIQTKGVKGESILSLAEKAGLPAVVVQKRTGQVVEVIKATSPEAVISRVKSLRGVN